MVYKYSIVKITILILYYTKEFRQRVSGDGSATNEIFGSILGGAIGNQFGGGSGKKVMTVAGALNNG
jgi:uncharacterized protein YcfJ